MKSAQDPAPTASTTRQRYNGPLAEHALTLNKRHSIWALPGQLSGAENIVAMPGGLTWDKCHIEKSAPDGGLMTKAVWKDSMADWMAKQSTGEIYPCEMPGKGNRRTRQMPSRPGDGFTRSANPATCRFDGMGGYP